MSTSPTKACVLTPDVAARWEQMVADQEIPDRGMVLNEQLTEQHLGDVLVYTLPSENVDAFLDDLNKVLGCLVRPSA